MCGLMAFKDDAEPGTVQSLVDLARRRGPDSFGIAWLEPLTGWTVERYRTPSWPNPFPIDFIPGSGAGIGHARLATSGTDIADAQPLKLDGMVFAHNGTVYHHQELAERYNLTLTTGNDSEVLARLWRLHNYSFHKTLKALEEHQGRTPHAWIASVGKTIWIASFGQPLYIGFSTACSWRFPDSAALDDGAVMFWEV